MWSFPTLAVPPPPNVTNGSSSLSLSLLPLLLLPFLLSRNGRTVSPPGAQPDLNIKGGLNLTYTTLNHVTSIGL